MYVYRYVYIYIYIYVYIYISIYIFLYACASGGTCGGGTFVRLRLSPWVRSSAKTWGINVVNGMSIINDYYIIMIIIT